RRELHVRIDRLDRRDSRSARRDAVPAGGDRAFHCDESIRFRRREAVVSTEGPHRSRYIVGPRYDWVFFLLPPARPLLSGIFVAHTPFSERTFPINGQSLTWEGVVIGAIIHAHLFAVIFRSHANPTIFRLHPFRFVVIPIVLWIAL